MANNDHKSLANDQLHNPKDFSTANNNTFLTKDGSGNLVWDSNSIYKSDFVQLGGYYSSSSNDEMTPQYSGVSTHNFNNVTNNPTDNGGEATQNSFAYAIRGGYINNWEGYLSGTASKTFKLKVYKGTPTSGSSSGFTLTQLGGEISVSATGNTTPIKFAGTGFGTSETFDKDDVLVVTVECDDAGTNSCWFNSTVEITYN